ncbi:MAG: hypothetical protein HY554_09565, partial [Elusimicrobia bacterium]|nr:hypothetical protein [Elusimicrobiota bacterium]
DAPAAPDLERRRQLIVQQVRELQAIEKVGLGQIQRMSASYREAARQTQQILTGLLPGVQADKTYFTVDYPEPSWAGSLQLVDDAFGDPDQGIIEKLRDNQDVLAVASACSQDLKGRSDPAADTDLAASCGAAGEKSLSRHDSHAGKLASFRSEMDAWAARIAGELGRRCPSEKKAEELTPKEKKHCDALTRIRASRAANDSKLRSAIDRLRPPWSYADPSATRALSTRIRRAKDRIDAELSALGQAGMAGATASATQRSLADASVKLGFALSHWERAHDASRSLEERGAEAGSGNAKLLAALVDLRRATQGLDELAAK